MVLLLYPIVSNLSRAIRGLGGGILCLDVVGGVLEDGCRVWSCPVLGKGKGWDGTIIKVWSGWRCSFGDGKVDPGKCRF